MFLEHNSLFSSLGWKVAPFSMKHANNLRTEWDRYFVNNIEFGDEYTLKEKVKIGGKIVYSLEARRKLLSLMKSISPDLCHAHNIYHHISPSILGLIKREGVPLVMTLHDLKIACPSYKMLGKSGICEACRGGKIYNVLSKRCIKESTVLSFLVMLESGLNALIGSYSRNVDRFVVPSQFYIDKFVEWGWDRSKFVYIPNFVDLKNYTVSGRPGNKFLYFGRISHEKGIGTLILAAAKAGVPVVVVGTGPDEEKMKQLANVSGGKVEFLGYKSGGALRDVIKQCRAVVVPSEWYENAPMAIMESYALGKIVIGSDIGGIPELIKEGATGFTFTAGSVDDLEKVLRRVVLKNSDVISDMGRCAREWIESNFTSTHYRERMLSLYRGLGVN